MLSRFLEFSFLVSFGLWPFTMTPYDLCSSLDSAAVGRCRPSERHPFPSRSVVLGFSHRKDRVLRCAPLLGRLGKSCSFLGGISESAVCVVLKKQVILLCSPPSPNFVVEGEGSHFLILFGGQFYLGKIFGIKNNGCYM